MANAAVYEQLDWRDSGYCVKQNLMGSCFANTSFYVILVKKTIYDAEVSEMQKRQKREVLIAQ